MTMAHKFYRGYVEAAPKTLLRGGVKYVLSSLFDNKNDAHEWVIAMSDQPNAAITKVIEVRSKKKRRRSH